MNKQMLATGATWTKEGVYIPKGFPVVMDEDDLNGDETNLVEADGIIVAPIVQVSPIAPTGPNPTQPQQIPPGTIQTAAGYVQPGGALLVGEVTKPQEERIDAAGLARPLIEEEIADLMSEGGQNDDDALVSGNAPDIIASLGGKTDDELKQLRAAEIDREKPRKTVTSAIDAELKARKEA